MAREYFHSYHSYLDSMEELSDAECGRLYRACLEYSMTGKAPELRGNEKIIFPSIRSQIDRDIENYNAKCQSQRDKANARWSNATACHGISGIAENAKGKDKGKGKDKDKGGKPPNPLCDGFNRFWQQYPKKVAKADAIKAWNKIKPDEELTETIIYAVTKWAASPNWTKDNGQFIPNPATFLNGRRWEDEIPKTGRYSELEEMFREVKGT